MEVKVLGFEDGGRDKFRFDQTLIFGKHNFIEQFFLQHSLLKPPMLKIKHIFDQKI